MRSPCSSVFFILCKICSHIVLKYNEARFRNAVAFHLGFLEHQSRKNRRDVHVNTICSSLCCDEHSLHRGYRATCCGCQGDLNTSPGTPVQTRVTKERLFASECVDRLSRVCWVQVVGKYMHRMHKNMNITSGLITRSTPPIAS